MSIYFYPFKARELIFCVLSPGEIHTFVANFQPNWTGEAKLLLIVILFSGCHPHMDKGFHRVTAGELLNKVQIA